MKRNVLALALLLAHAPVFGASYADLMKEGDSHRAAGEADAAIRSYRLAAGGTLDIGQAARAWYRIGQVCESQQEWERAARAYGESLERKRYPETEQALARIEGRKVGRVVPAGEIVRSLSPAHTRDLRVEPAVNLFVNFDFDKDTLTSDGVAQVAELAKALANPEFAAMRIELVGHTDQVGSDAYNLALSERRAQRVRDVLVSRFQSPDARFTVKGMGKQALLDSADTDEAHRLNRRVEVRLLGDGGSGQ